MGAQTQTFLRPSVKAQRGIKHIPAQERGNDNNHFIAAWVAGPNTYNFHKLSQTVTGIPVACE
ncbi:MAG: hypothetical protein WCL29_06935, partial [Pseudomonadota bacterium]